MFTGIIEEIGIIARIQNGGTSAVVEVQAQKVLEGTKIGDSIAVNGVCLTVTGMGAGRFTADVMAETLRRSSLGIAQRGSQVNLERAMAADGRFGGHIVSGHIDGTGIIKAMTPEDTAVWVEIDASGELMRYIVEKGSIAIDGISLTVAKRTDQGFAVSLIPHTGAETTLLRRKPGDIVNLENDIIGKYVEQLLAKPPSGAERQSSIDLDFLAGHGFI